MIKDNKKYMLKQRYEIRILLNCSCLDTNITFHEYEKRGLKYAKCLHFSMQVVVFLSFFTILCLARNWKVELSYLTLHLVCFYSVSLHPTLQLDFLTGLLFSVRGTPGVTRNLTWKTLTK
jgi:hypothetical protein